MKRKVEGARYLQPSNVKHFRGIAAENVAAGHTKFGAYAGSRKISLISKVQMVDGERSGVRIKSHAQRRPVNRAGPAKRITDPLLLGQYCDI